MKTSTEQKDIWGWDAAPKIGRYVRPDGWSIGECLIAGDDFSSFRLPTNSNGPIKSLAVEIETTGRTLRKAGGMRCVRVKVTFVGDCEPDQVCGGWMEVPWD